MKKTFNFILSLVVLAIVGWVFWKIINFYIEALKTLDKQVAAAIVAASTTIIVSVVSLILAKYYENKRLIEKDIRDKKIVVYEKLIKFFFQFMGSKNKAKVQGMEEFYIEFAPSFITWGSDEVIKHWSVFRKVATNGDAHATIAQFEQLLLIIRKDIGHQNKDIDKNKVLLGTFVNDLDSIFPKK